MAPLRPPKSPRPRNPTMSATASAIKSTQKATLIAPQTPKRIRARMRSMSSHMPASIPSGISGKPKSVRSRCRRCCALDRLRPRALERLQQDVARLRAGHGVAAVEHEEGDAGDADGGGLALVVTHLVRDAVVGERCPGSGGIETGIGGELDQCVRVGQLPALAEVAAQEPLLGLPLHP